MTDVQIEQPTQAVAQPSPNGPVNGVEQAKPAAGSMILFENVTKVYEPDVTALDSVNFAIDKGEFVFIVGASGSGKTTLVRLLLKELEPTDGRIIMGGRDLGRLSHSSVPRLRRNIGCVFQDFKLLPSRTAAENVAYALKVQGESRSAIRRKVPEVMTLVGLASKKAQERLGDPKRWPELFASVPGGRIGEPAEIASMVAFLASPKSNYTSGAVITLDAGVSSRGGSF